MKKSDETKRLKLIVIGIGLFSSTIVFLSLLIYFKGEISIKRESPNDNSKVDIFIDFDPTDNYCKKKKKDNSDEIRKEILVPLNPADKLPKSVRALKTKHFKKED